MRTDPQIRKLKIGLNHLRDYDLSNKEKRRVISISLSSSTLQKIGGIQNRSRFIEAAIESSLAKQP